VAGCYRNQWPDDPGIRTGLGNVSWGGKGWTVLGGILSFGAIEETNQVVASGTMLSLSAVPVDLVALDIRGQQVAF
jgi:hypothetical protein